MKSWLFRCIVAGHTAVLALAVPSAWGQPPARDGVLDLRGWDAVRDGPVELRGEWLITWGRFDAPVAAGTGQPAAVPLEVPGPWNALEVDGRRVGADGFATYALTVQCHQSPALALLVPGAAHSAMRLYVNGKLLAEQGRPGGDAALAQPKLATTLAPLGADLRCPLRIVAHVSNFSHRHGGMVRAPRLGDHHQLAAKRERNLAMDIALMGGFAVMGLLPLLFFAVRRSETPALWFGLFCWSMAVYIGFARERSLQHLFLDIGWESHLKFEYLGWYLAGPSFLLFARGLFPGEFGRRTVAVAVACVLLPSLFVLLGPARLYSHTVPFVQAVTVLMALYSIGATGLAAWRRRPSAWVCLAGIGVLGAAVVFDILQYKASLQSTVTPFGILAFALAPAAVLTQRFARALTAEELRALEQRHRVNLLVRATKAGILDWDAGTDVVRLSERFQQMLGRGAAASSSWAGFFETVHADDREGIRSWVQSMLADRSVRSGQRDHPPVDFRLLHAQGQAVWVHAEALSLNGADGAPLRCICSLIDVTEQRELEDELRASRDQVAEQAARLERQNETLQEHVRLREEVERIGRHDLKTPINSIVAVPRLLREEGRLGQEADELLAIVERAGYRILSMVNLSLDLYKMEQGSYVFRPAAVDLVDLLDKVGADVGTHAAAKQIRLKVDAGAAPYGWAEELLCYSLLANLMRNAIEASPEGGEVSVAALAGPGETVVLRIHNHGAVPASVRGTFFQKYATSGKAGGTGLGAYSARLMARVQDGDIEMQTSKDAGTTLTVRLRAAPAGAAPAALRQAAGRDAIALLPHSALPAMRVLLVDDDEYNLLILRRYLPSPPFAVATAINGREALSAARLQWPDVIFMDLEMPVMGGLQAVQELRALERATQAKRCTMIALSSHEDDETRRRSLAAGFDSYLAKPVSRDAIHGALLEPKTVKPAPGSRDAVIVDSEVEPLLADFMVSRRELIAAMERAMQAGERGEVRRIAHQLAGSFGLYGFHWASERSGAIEKEFNMIAPGLLRQVAVELREHLDTVEIRFESASL
jgi:signal transduction histidine kinase/ActR/RegA family two-component response regulator